MPTHEKQLGFLRVQIVRTYLAERHEGRRNKGEQGGESGGGRLELVVPEDPSVLREVLAAPADLHLRHLGVGERGNGQVDLRPRVHELVLEEVHHLPGPGGTRGDGEVHRHDVLVRRETPAVAATALRVDRLPAPPPRTR